MTRRSLLQAIPAAAGASAFAQPPSSPPNIVFLISDDHSRPDLGCYGNSSIRTPNLDRLAREGMRFTNGFVASPQCSPNRSAILTGMMPHTTSTSRLHTPMPPWQDTVLEGLKARNYFCGAFRKVHQGEQFDQRWDYYGGSQAKFEEFFQALPAGRPFFLHFGSTDPHRPYSPGAVNPPHDPGKVRVPPFLPDTPLVRQDLALYADEIGRFDRECGEIMKLLEERGLSNNTVVIMTGDNGMPFPRAKGTCYDPGLNVPLIAWWPGRIRPGASDALISHVDFAPTWLEAAGAPAHDGVQGRSFLPLLTGGQYAERDAIYAERNWHDNFDPIRAVRTRTHKLIFNAIPRFEYRPAWDLENSPTWADIVRLGRAGELAPEHRTMLETARAEIELYDLENDPNEFHNLATHPDYQTIRSELEQKLSEWMVQTYDYLPPIMRQSGRFKSPRRPPVL